METSYIYGLAGGCLIGLGSLVAFLATQKIPGISGILGRSIRPAKGDYGWRIAFLVGLVVGAAILIQTVAFAGLYEIPDARNGGIYILAGLLVGFGTRLGRGCTSGHGVCGIGMGLRESIFATLIFMASGIATVFLFRLLFPAT